MVSRSFQGSARKNGVVINMLYAGLGKEQGENLYFAHMSYGRWLLSD